MSEHDHLDRMRDAAVTRIFAKCPELESADVELLRLLLGYAWIDGYMEAELILRGGQL